MKGNVIALGFFDGVHLGHGQLLKRCRAAADEMGLSACALTFDTHPDTLVTGKPVQLLNSPEDRELLMKSRYGIDRILTLHFDARMRDTPWQTFFTGILLEQYGARYLICGQDFCFGLRGQGNYRRLREICPRYGVGFEMIPEYQVQGITVSSTYLRGLIQRGEVERAAEFYGHPHILTGQLLENEELLPPEGVLLPGAGTYRCRGIQGTKDQALVVTVGPNGTLRIPGAGDFASGQLLRLEFLGKE